jgi:site-specific DNA-methyltransferase (adenine-specific)
MPIFQPEFSDLPPAQTPPPTTRRVELSQYFTPAWVPEIIIQRHFCDLSEHDRVIDAGTAQRGEFLRAIPSHVPAIGVEIDPDLAAAASAATGRQVLVGDFRTIDLPFQPTVILGNPPFSRAVAEGFLERAYREMPLTGRCGFILPSSFLSFASTFDTWRSRFSIDKEELPRDLFPRIRVPISFFLFAKQRIRRFRGFFLFDEALAVGQAPKPVRMALIHGTPHGSVWRFAVVQAMKDLGGRATLAQLYSYLSGRCPRAINTWRDTVRRTLQEGGFINVRRGLWQIAEPVGAVA